MKPMSDRERAEKLWQLLDDISTCFDAYHPKMDGFEKNVHRLCEKRNEYFESDGYKLYYPGEVPI